MLLYCKLKKQLLNWFIFKPVQTSYYFQDDETSNSESLDISIQTEQFSINFFQSEKCLLEDSPQKHLTIPLKSEKTQEIKKSIILKYANIESAQNFDIEAFELNCDGNNIAAVYIQPLKIDTKFLMIHSHSNNPDIGICIQEYLNYCNQFKVNIIGYDYPGYGLSQGKPNDKNIFRTIQCVYNFAQSLGYKDNQIIAFGQSLGTSPTLYLASQVKIAGIILRSSYKSILNIISNNSQNYKRDIFKNYEIIQQVEIPILIIHGDQDELVNVEQAQELFQLCKTQEQLKQIVVLKDATHNALGNNEKEYFDRINQFIEMLYKIY